MHGEKICTSHFLVGWYDSFHVMPYDPLCHDGFISPKTEYEHVMAAAQLWPTITNRDSECTTRKIFPIFYFGYMFWFFQSNLSMLTLSWFISQHLDWIRRHHLHPTCANSNRNQCPLSFPLLLCFKNSYFFIKEFPPSHQQWYPSSHNEYKVLQSSSPNQQLKAGSGADEVGFSFHIYDFSALAHFIVQLK